MIVSPAPRTSPEEPPLPMTNPKATTPSHQELLNGVAEHARQAGVFAAVEVRPDAVVCEAKASAASAQYRVTIENGHVYVELTTQDRWLSHSIEADLLNTGDKLEELIDEELIELGGAAIHAKVEHFRNDAKLFVFRSKLACKESTEPEPGDSRSVQAAFSAILAYEAAFRHLGEMNSRNSG